MFFNVKNTKIGMKIELLFTEIGRWGANLNIPISKIDNADLTKFGSLIHSKSSCHVNADMTNCREQH